MITLCGSIITNMFIRSYFTVTDPETFFSDVIIFEESLLQMTLSKKISIQKIIIEYSRCKRTKMFTDSDSSSKLRHLSDDDIIYIDHVLKFTNRRFRSVLTNSPEEIIKFYRDQNYSNLKKHFKAENS